MERGGEGEEGREQEQSSSKEPVLTRRDALKVGAVGLAALLFKPSGNQDVSASELLDQEKVLSEVAPNPYVESLLSSVPSLGFNEQGTLVLGTEDAPVPLLETNRYKTYPYEKVNEVRLFVLHYDGAPIVTKGGRKRTIGDTLDGLNGEGLPSVQFLVDDAIPSSENLPRGEGLGIAMSQRTSDERKRPYKGRHVTIGKVLGGPEAGREDGARILTVEQFQSLGIESRLLEMVSSGEKDFDSFTLGVEQVGNHDDFSMLTEENYPPNQQIKNMLGLVRAVALEHNLSVWDIVGHREIQEKSDPGDAYMLSMRYLLGLMYMRSPRSFPSNFLEADSPSEFFFKLAKYGNRRMGSEDYDNWNEVWGLNELIVQIRVFENSVRLRSRK